MHPKFFVEKISVLSVMVLFFLSVSGCKKQALPEGMPELQETKITIMQDGAPLADASIAFIPIDSSNPWSAGATTGPDGSAKMLTQNNYPGVVSGKYKILITKRESDESKLVAPDPNTDPAAYTKYMNESRKEKLVSYDLIDPKYSRTTSTPEDIDIVQGKNEKTIDVGNAVRVQRK